MDAVFGPCTSPWGLVNRSSVLLSLCWVLVLHWAAGTIRGMWSPQSLKTYPPPLQVQPVVCTSLDKYVVDMNRGHQFIALLTETVHVVSSMIPEEAAHQKLSNTSVSAGSVLGDCVPVTSFACYCFLVTSFCQSHTDAGAAPFLYLTRIIFKHSTAMPALRYETGDLHQLHLSWRRQNYVVVWKLSLG